MIQLSVHELKHSFPGRVLFEGLTFGIFEGQKIALIGQNGAGKSTLLKILQGTLDADEGRVTRASGLNVGYLPQVPEFLENKRVSEFSISSVVISQIQLEPYLDKMIWDLSGGWQKKVALAIELSREPDVLFLDEPTNHLDIESIIWLEEFIRKSRLTFVITSHDRAFLRRTCNRVIEVDRRNPNGILSVDGTLEEFFEKKQAYLDSVVAREASLKNTLRREMEWLARGAKARTTKQKARIDRALDLKDEVADWSQRLNQQASKIEIDRSALEGVPKKLAELKGATKSYGDKVLFKNFNLLISGQTRLGLIGNNGTGKSTLSKILLGLEDLTSGEIKRSERIQPIYFEQNRSELDPEESVLKNICPYGETVEYMGRKIHVRSYLDRFLFSGNDVEKLVAKLSGGEQARLLIAKLFLRPGNLLVLDEPTNDLDFQTLGILEDALDEFPGAVILVTHDREFMGNVCDQILGFPEMQFYADIPQYMEHWRKRERASDQFERDQISKEKTDKEKVDGNSFDTTSQNRTPQKKRLSYMEQREWDSMESKISECEQELALLEQESARPDVISNSVRLNEISSEMGELQQELDRLYARWAELEEKAK